MPVFNVESPLTIGRLVMPVVIFLAMPAAQPALRAQEKTIVSLKEFISTEVRQQGFTLPKAMKVHVHAQGGGTESVWGEHGHLFAYGWILNASTREVVWQMNGANSHRKDLYRVADQELDLPSGAYEAYFSNHAFGRDTMFSHWSRNIDRRNLLPEGKGAPEKGHGFLSLVGADHNSQLRIWRERAQNYGLELSVAGGNAAQVQTFEAPLSWKNTFVSLTKTGDNGQWDQAFHLKKAASIHVYAIGEGQRGDGMKDYGWILNAHTRKRVWEMSADKAQYAGGASKNLRQVETIQLPAGDYVASFATDDCHSPADWNAAPPCDPGKYGLTLAVPDDAEFSRVALTELKGPGPLLAETLRVRDEQDCRAPFTLTTDQTVQIRAIGEGDDSEMVDFAWIEDARTGKTVWTMEFRNTHPAGGSLKNRMVDECVPLPKGSYNLRFKTDDSHAYGDWNAAPPRDPEHYGASVYVAGR